MPSTILPHYLRTHRKRVCLSQDELAWLLGCRHGSKVSRYERFARKPALETVFAYEIVFRVPARQLFAGIFAAVEHATLKRVELLVRRLQAGPSNQSVAIKLAALQAIDRRRRSCGRR